MLPRDAVLREQRPRIIRDGYNFLLTLNIYFNISILLLLLLLGYINLLWLYFYIHFITKLIYKTDQNLGYVKRLK